MSPSGSGCDSPLVAFRMRQVRPRMIHTLTRKGMTKSEARSALESGRSTYVVFVSTYEWGRSTWAKRVPSSVPAFGYQQDPTAASEYLIACSVKGPSFRAGSARLVLKTPSERTTLPCIRHLAASHAFEHQVSSSGLGYQAAGLAHRAGYLLGTFLPRELKRPFIPLQQL
ncbi:hypothetical protein Taro_034795 [Colocasia esculenta]|uniref:Uncharacterized protein n=1 Tax=Colocasia esculenta TaxID=4460 RepID=A0A843VYN9_COLES|nr:hypothetical protein [Colocasia esculenta]